MSDAVIYLASASPRRSEMLDQIGVRHEQLVGAVEERHVDGEREASRLSVSAVTMRALSKDECARYCDSGEPIDKAGAYAIQGRAAQFIVRLEGSYSGVMGLPLFETAELLREFDVIL